MGMSSDGIEAASITLGQAGQTYPLQPLGAA
jgi:hypothetical protein